MPIVFGSLGALYVLVESARESIVTIDDLNFGEIEMDDPRAIRFLGHLPVGENECKDYLHQVRQEALLRSRLAWHAINRIEGIDFPLDDTDGAKVLIS